MGFKKALFLDRDGVVNRSFLSEGKPYPPRKIEDFILLPGVLEALDQSKKLGFLNIIVTNQPDVSKGKTTKIFVDKCHKKLRELGLIDDIYTCFHDDKDLCSCRKPKPGMLLNAQKKWNINLSKSFLVGDRWKDVEAGQSVGCSCFFINYGYNERKPDSPFFEVENLKQAVKIIKREINA